MAKQAGEIVGTHFLERRKDDSSRPIFHINNLHVVPRLRRQGVAKLLKSFAEGEALKRGAVALTTIVDLHNPRIIEFNKNLGYRIVAYTQRKDLK